MRPMKFFFAIFVGMLFTGCGHLFYYPDNVSYVNVKNLPYQPQEVEFTSNEGLKLTGWYFKSPNKARAQILFFHGNAQNISSHFASLYWILNHNYDFFIFDYPGYGQSEGKPTQKNTTEAGTKALEWLVQHNPYLPTAIFGQSLGGNIAMYTAVENKDRTPICLVAVESTFKSYRKVGQRALARHWLTWLFQGIPYVVVSDRYSADQHIQNISPIPLLVMHGDADPIVGYENGQDVFVAAREPKEFYPVIGGQHIDAFSGPSSSSARKKFTDALEKFCTKPKN